MFQGLILTFVEVTGEKLVAGLFWGGGGGGGGGGRVFFAPPPSPPPSWIGLRNFRLNFYNSFLNLLMHLVQNLKSKMSNQFICYAMISDQ